MSNLIYVCEVCQHASPQWRGSVLKRDLYGWVNKNPPISTLPPAEPGFLLLWNSLSTADLNVAQDNGMQVLGEENSSNSVLLLLCVCLCVRAAYVHRAVFVGAFIVNNIRITVCFAFIHITTMSPWVQVFAKTTLRKPVSYWFFKTWLKLPKNTVTTWRCKSIWCI